MNRRIPGAGLALALIAGPAAGRDFPENLPPPPPPPTVGIQPTAPVPDAHWSRPLLRRLAFESNSSSSRPLSSSRLDAAIHLARWLERGRPSPGARPRLLAAEYAADLKTLGLSAEAITAALERLQPAVPAPESPVAGTVAGGARGDRTRRLVEESLNELRSIEARLRRLEARRK